jgi:hypothetical protein
MPDSSLHCGNDLRKLADRTKIVSWYVVSRAYFEGLDESFEELYVKGAF